MITSLPLDVLSLIIDQLNPVDHGACFRTCTRLRNCVNHLYIKTLKDTYNQTSATPYQTYRKIKLARYSSVPRPQIKFLEFGWPFQVVMNKNCYAFGEKKYAVIRDRVTNQLLQKIELNALKHFRFIGDQFLMISKRVFHLTSNEYVYAHKGRAYAKNNKLIIYIRNKRFQVLIFENNEFKPQGTYTLKHHPQESYILGNKWMVFRKKNTLIVDLEDLHTKETTSEKVLHDFLQPLIPFPLPEKINKLNGYLHFIAQDKTFIFDPETNRLITINERFFFLTDLFIKGDRLLFINAGELIEYDTANQRKRFDQVRSGGYINFKKYKIIDVDDDFVMLDDKYLTSIYNFKTHKIHNRLNSDIYRIYGFDYIFRLVHIVDTTFERRCFNYNPNEEKPLTL